MYQQPYYSRPSGEGHGDGIGGGVGGGGGSGVAGAGGDDDDDEYEERGLYDGSNYYARPVPYATASPGPQARPLSRASYGRPSPSPGPSRGRAQRHPPPPRTSFSSPAPPLQRTSNSFEVGSVYSSSERYSAPPDYPPYHSHQQQQQQQQQQSDPRYYPYNNGNAAYPYAAESPMSPPGGYPDMYAPNMDQGMPPPSSGEHYWYAGAPSVVSSGRTLSYDPYGGQQYGSGDGRTPMRQSYQAEDAPSYFGVSAPHHYPGAPSAGGGGGGRPEVLPNFPQWSRTWYGGHLSADGHAYTTVPPGSGGSGWESESMTRSGGGDPRHHIYGRTAAGGMLSDPVKEERMRMLEKEFGKPKIRHTGANGDGDDDDKTVRGDGEEEDDDDEAELPLGSVTARGKLITERPRWMLAARWLMGLAALAAFACGIGGALLIKPDSNDVPATRGSIASYVVYAASAITLVAVVYLHVLRPCCCDPMRRLAKPGGAQGGLLPGGAGGLVIPILSGGQAPGKRPKMPRGKKGRMMMQQQAAPTVNLIVDPTLLGGGKRKGGDDSSDEDNEDGERLPGDARRKKKRKNGLGVLGHMQMTQRWRVARHTVKLLLIWDCVLSLVWLVAAVVAIAFPPKSGGSCKPGTGQGWCDFYNAAIACGVIFAATAWVAVYLGYRALKVSSKPPRAI